MAVLGRMKADLGLADAETVDEIVETHPQTLVQHLREVMWRDTDHTGKPGATEIRFQVRLVRGHNASQALRVSFQHVARKRRIAVFHRARRRLPGHASLEALEELRTLEAEQADQEKQETVGCP